MDDIPAGKEETDVRIVCIAPYVPGELIGHAGGAFLYRYLATLARDHDVHLLAPATTDNLTFLQHVPTGVQVHLVAIRQPTGVAHRQRTRIRNAVRGLTPGWPVLDGFRQDVAARALLASADVVEIQWDHMLALLDVLPELGSVPVVAVALDIVTQSFQRRTDTASGLQALSLRCLTRRVAAQERRLLNACAHVRVLSGKDARVIEALGVRTPVDVVPPLLVAPDKPAPAGRSGVVACIGALWRPENVDGLLWFAEEVWPAVRRACPAAQLVLTGARPSAELLSLDGSDGIVVEGFRADLRPAFDRAGVFVVPLRQGAGIKVKVLEAMLHRLPVVTTAVGAEGIEDEAPPGALLVAADAQSMAAMVVGLIEDAGQRAAAAEIAWGWARDQFSAERVEARVLEIYAGGAGERLRAHARSS
ncbi:MAG: hypothetical protein QOJ11_662 [Frankiales bacterium]|jgi:glycosyltransferase involved in cell wall biosynthesis|nr:hypothetical protein [Frankiales bacterium]